MDIIIGLRHKIEHSSNASGFTLWCLIVSTLILVMIATSCSAIPGGKESDAVVNSFMTAAVAKDVDAACACFASPVEEGLKKDIEELILSNHQLFEGYQEVKMRSISVHTGKIYTEAEYGGQVTYSGDFKGWVEATLVKRGEVWMLTGINIEISQEKLDDYNKRHGGS